MPWRAAAAAGSASWYVMRHETISWSGDPLDQTDGFRVDPKQVLFEAIRIMELKRDLVTSKYRSNYCPNVWIHG